MTLDQSERDRLNRLFKDIERRLERLEEETESIRKFILEGKPLVR